MSSFFNNYKEIQNEYSSFIIFYKIGSFYEIFGENAITIGNLLGLTVIDKPIKDGKKIPMCGIPVKSKDIYLARLLDLNYRVVITDEFSDVEKKITAREVIRLVTPGTVTDDYLIRNKIYQDIVMINSDENFYYISSLDLTIGTFEIYKTKKEKNKLNSILFSIDPSEIIYHEESLKKEIEDVFDKISNFFEVKIDDKLLFEIIQEINSISTNLNINLSSFNEAEIKNIYIIFKYIKIANKKEELIIKNINKINEDEYCEISSASFYGLEIFRNYQGDRYGTLFEFLSDNCTRSAKRVLKTIISRPSVSKYIIENRLDLVEFFIKNEDIRLNLQKKIKEVGDLERSIVKFLSETNIKSEAVNIKLGFNKLKEIFDYIIDIPEKPNLFEKITQKMKNLYSFILFYCDQIDQESSIDLIEFKYIINRVKKITFDVLCLKVEKLIKDVEKYSSDMESFYKIKCKLLYNSKYNFHFEIDNKVLDKIPKELKQLEMDVKKSYFSSDFLIKINNNIRNQKNQLKTIEDSFLKELQSNVKFKVAQILDVLENVSLLEILLNFAQISQKYQYSRPEILEKDKLIFKADSAFHPVLKAQKVDVVENSYKITEEENCFLITGINMGGKSTFLKQNGIIAILAQIGCFTPAKKLQISLVDKIFTRVGAMDKIKEGKSTFYLEMLDIKEIFDYSTKYSLCLLDEVCIGTCYKEGLVIFEEILKYIALSIKARVIISTHYHEIQEILSDYKNIAHFSFGFKVINEKVVLDFKLKKEKTKSSYPIHAIKMAQFPIDIINKIQEKLENIEN